MNTTLKSRFALLTALCLLSTSLCACGSEATGETPAETDASQSTEATDTPAETEPPQSTEAVETAEETAALQAAEPASSVETTHITETLVDGVEVDADAKIPAAVDFTQLSVYDAEIQKIDFEKAKEILLNGKQVISEETMEAMESLTGSDYILCQTEDDYTLVSQGQDLFFSGTLHGNVGFAVAPEEESGAACITGENLPFATIEEAEANIFAVLDELQIPYTTDVTCYTLTAEKLAELYQERSAEAGDPNASMTTEPEDCYYLFIPLAVEGMPISQSESGSFGDGSFMAGTCAECLYTEEGIAALNINYSYQITGTEETSAGIDLTGALDLLKQKYESVIIQGEYEVTGISFEYLPMPQNGDARTVQMIPAWRFTVLQTIEMPGKTDDNTTDTVTIQYSVLFDAITGNELPVDNGGM